MSLHKLTAGSGYDYLTRQVARQDVTEPSRGMLGDYYSAKGEEPERFKAVNMAVGLPKGHPVPAEVRSRIRSEVATELFRAEHGRDQANARELSAALARYSRSSTTAVAGFDHTFSLVKSVSTLWAVGPAADACRD